MVFGKKKSAAAPSSESPSDMSSLDALVNRLEAVRLCLPLFRPPAKAHHHLNTSLTVPTLNCLRVCVYVCVCVCAQALAAVKDREIHGHRTFFVYDFHARCLPRSVCVCARVWMCGCVDVRLERAIFAKYRATFHFRPLPYLCGCSSMGGVCVRR